MRQMVLERAKPWCLLDEGVLHSDDSAGCGSSSRAPGIRGRAVLAVPVLRPAPASSAEVLLPGNGLITCHCFRAARHRGP